MYTKLDKFLEDSCAVLLTSSHNMRYFSGFSGGEGAVFVSEGQRLVFTDSRYVQQASAETPFFDVIETNDWMREVCSMANQQGIKKLYYEDESIVASAFLKLTDRLETAALTCASAEINNLRMIKTDAELDIMRDAEAICCRAFERILDFLRPDITEKQLAARLEYYMRQEGGEGTAFETIAISGERCSLPHGVPTDKKIQSGDFVTMDFGCVFKGYCSDMTRTVVVGKASDQQKKIYSAVKTAQQNGLDAICCGAIAKDVDLAVRKTIEELGFGDYFKHSLGHGVGLVVHEFPNLSPKSEIILEENMVVTCEPGIYIPGFGGVRIEDMVCVKKNSTLNFTTTSKELIEL